MDAFDFILHLLNFLAPALVVALVLALFGPFFMPNSQMALNWIARTAINFVAGAVPLCVGLWYFGRDGKMVTYAAMLLCGTLSQALLSRYRE